MMFLNRLYSEPAGLFKHTVKHDGVIEFKNGINYIFGKKDSDNDAVESLNGIGKSLFLDLIDFCLLASFDKSKNPRLYEAKEYLSGYKIVLQFEINDTTYVIKRSVDNPSKVEFQTPVHITTFETTYELGQVLCDLIFKTPGYAGYYENNLLRKLLPFFLKIHRPKAGRLTDPIKYINECYPTELNQYHLFLLGFNNALASENFTIQNSLKEKKPALIEIEKMVKGKYGLKKINDIENEIDNLNREINQLDGILKTYKLADQYKDAEQQINALTGDIKKNVHLNFLDGNKVKQYRQSYEQKEELTNIRQIGNIYTELNELLGTNIKKQLQEAVSFRKSLSQSREEFLAEEIAELESNIRIRAEIIKIKEIERAKLFDFLEITEAIKDLTEALYNLNEKKKKRAELEANINLYHDISKDVLRLKTQESQLQERIGEFVADIRGEISQFRDVFNMVYNHIYPELKNKSLFNIYHDFLVMQKIILDVSMPAMRSEGKNQGRTLVYDIALLLHAVEEGLKMPGFLVHDGIFDSMDKAHFVATVNFLNSIEREGKRFQYIIPINEEGTLNDNFGKIDDVTPEKIEQEAIIVLTPSKKLLGKTWS